MSQIIDRRRVFNCGLVELLTVSNNYGKEFEFRIKCPMFATYNLISCGVGTFSKFERVDDEFYFPDNLVDVRGERLTEHIKNTVYRKLQNYCSWGINFIDKLLDQHKLVPSQIDIFKPQNQYIILCWRVSEIQLRGLIQMQGLSLELQEYLKAIDTLITNNSK